MTKIFPDVVVAVVVMVGVGAVVIIVGSDIDVVGVVVAVAQCRRRRRLLPEVWRCQRQGGCLNQFFICKGRDKDTRKVNLILRPRVMV